MPNKPKMNVFNDQKSSQKNNSFSERKSWAEQQQGSETSKGQKRQRAQGQTEDKRRYQESKAVAELFLTIPLKPKTRKRLERLAQRAGLEPHRCVELAVRGLIWTGPWTVKAFDRGTRWADDLQKRGASLLKFVEGQLQEAQRKSRNRT